MGESCCCRAVQIGGVPVGNDRSLFVIAGPCVIESQAMAIDIAAHMQEVCADLDIFYVFKASFDKANRTALQSFRGPGMEKGLQALEAVRQQVAVPVLTDVHEDTPLEEVSAVVDVLQTPAFLARQTRFILRVAAAKVPVNIKKAPFMAPWDMRKVVEKAKSVGNESIMVCERGSCFGYNSLVSDMRALIHLRTTGCPVVFDASHSVQQPGGQGDRSGGERAMVPVLARAATAVGVAGLFIETHPHPDVALSDGPNMWPLGQMKNLLCTLKAIDEVAKGKKRSAFPC